MNANTTALDLSAREPVDDLLDAPAYDPLDAPDPAYDADAAARGETPEEAARHAAVEAEEDFLPYVGDPDADRAPALPADDRPAEVRTQELFDRMRPRRRVLLAILRACAEPREPDAVAELVDGMQRSSKSVYDGPALCSLLERAGALERRREEPAEPRTVVVDGAEYLEPAEPPRVLWVATPAGLAMVDADRPMDRLHAKLDAESQYKPIYLRVLRACAIGDGCSAKELGDLVDHDPLVQKPRMFAGHFFGVLWDAEALSWDGTWRTTELGREIVAELEAEGVTE